MTIGGLKKVIENVDDDKEVFFLYDCDRIFGYVYFAEIDKDGDLILHED